MNSVLYQQLKSKIHMRSAVFPFHDIVIPCT